MPGLFDLCPASHPVVGMPTGHNKKKGGESMLCSDHDGLIPVLMWFSVGVFSMKLTFWWKH